jgi:hypothetical protein
MEQDLIDETEEKTVMTAYASAGWQFDAWYVQPESLLADNRLNPTPLNIGAVYQTITALFIPIPGYVDENDGSGGGDDSGTGCFIQSCNKIVARFYETRRCRSGAKGKHPYP